MKAYIEYMGGGGGHGRHVCRRNKWGAVPFPTINVWFDDGFLTELLVVNVKVETT